MARRVVMISSTALDLPEHRGQVRDACLERGMFPLMMDHLPASSADAIAESLRMVNEAEIYVGVFAHRYGYVPDGHPISITEMEYNRAVERGIPRLIFLMDRTHPIQIDAVEQGEAAGKLNTLKERLKKEQVVKFFKSPEDLRAHVLNSLMQVPAEPQETKPAEPPYSLSNPPFFMPYRRKGDNFVGRTRELDAIRRLLTAGRPSRFAKASTASIQGIGGLGKTQLAVEYAHVYKDKYPNGIVWLSADQDIAAQLTRLAVDARWIAPQSDHNVKLEAARNRLRTYSDCLIIFDNVVEQAAFQPYLPEGQAAPHLLITSRLEQPGFEPVSLPLLDGDESLRMLLQESGRTLDTPEDDAAARAIAGRLAGLPLALETAAAYLRYRQAVRWPQYQQTLEKDWKTALTGRFLSSATGHAADLHATLAINQQIFADEPALRGVVDLLTYSGTASMGLPLLCNLLGVEHLDLIGPLSLGVALRLLETEQKAGESLDHSRYRIHRLVQEVRRDQQPLQQAGQVASICQRLGDWFEARRADEDDLPLFEAEIDHLRVWQQHAKQVAPQHACRLTWLQAYPPFHRNMYAESQKWVEEAMRLLALDPGNKRLEAHLKNDLAHLLTQQGFPQKGREYLEEAVALYQREFGEKAFETAGSLTNLGGTYLACKNWRRALECYERALAIRREVCGERHSDTARTLLSIAQIHVMRTPRRGLELSLEALNILIEAHGPKHKYTIVGYMSVGEMYLRLNDQKQALEYLKKALAASQAVYGDNHPGTAGAMMALGSAYLVGGREDVAHEYFIRSLQIQRAVLGKDSPETLKVLEKVTEAFTNGNRKTEAYDLVMSFLDIVPKTHPAFTTLHNMRKKVLASSAALRERVEGKTRPARKGNKKKKR